MGLVNFLQSKLGRAYDLYIMRTRCQCEEELGQFSDNPRLKAD